MANDGHYRGGNARNQVKGRKMAEREERDREAYVDGSAHEGGPVVPAERLVHRERLLRDLRTQGEEAGITVIVAPDGFGKTTLLVQRVAEVRSRIERGSARMLDLEGLDEVQAYESIKRLSEDLDPRMRPLIALDNLTTLQEHGIEAMVGLLRSMRGEGFEIVVTCRPSNRAFVAAMGDSYKITAQSLLVKPREYPAWARKLSIASGLDVYGLTQGVPRLVAMLGDATSIDEMSVAFENATVELYRGVVCELRRSRDSLYRTVCLLIMSGFGSIRDFDRAGMRVRKDSWLRLAREYPIFGFDAKGDAYRCMSNRGVPFSELKCELVHARPLYAVRAAKMMLEVGNIDGAVALMRMLEREGDATALIAEYPTACALSGNGAFLTALVERMGGAAVCSIQVGVVLALYLCALERGDYRAARIMAAELRRRSSEILDEVSPSAWRESTAMAAVWSDCSGVALPDLNHGKGHDCETVASRQLELHVRVQKCIMAGDGAVSIDEGMGINEASLGAKGISIPGVLLACDRILLDAFKGDVGDARALDNHLQEVARLLTGRHLDPIASYVRVVGSTCRLMAGLPVVDERAFVDGGTASVRCSDFAMQLYCLVGEGWQDLAVGQIVSAQFRAQQVKKLASPDQGFVLAWASFLECAAHLLNSSHVVLNEEADELDAGEGECTVVDAWTVAMLLSATSRLPELSAWCSLRRPLLLDEGMRARARQLIRAVGERAMPLARMLPEGFSEAAPEGKRSDAGAPALFDVASVESGQRLGRVTISLFGGFQAMRNGHTLTDALWRRKKACVIAARLALAGGNFVGRQVIMEEMWPDKDYKHARESMYSSLSSLRAAFGQHADGPQYVLTQGEGVALNMEYVVSDTACFDALARDVLLRRTGTSSREIIETCLKIEEIYKGPLYVPESGNTSYYLRVRRVYQMKFADCMVRGIEAALEMDDLPSASWLVEAALRQAPLREDVIRCAMRIYDKTGRRREIVELYNSHLHLLEQELGSIPEEETRMTYESIIGRSGMQTML